MKKTDDLAIYPSENGSIELKADTKNETVWAAKRQIAELFGIDRSVVSRYIKNIFKDAELDEKLVCAKFAHTTQHGAVKEKKQTYLVDYYNLDIILSAGYRKNSSHEQQPPTRKRATCKESLQVQKEGKRLDRKYGS